MTCKDCLYFKRCVSLGVELNIKQDKEADKNCRHFTNKANFIELPCKVGDVVYVIFSTFYAEYKVRKFICDGSFVWAKLVNEEYEPQSREIFRCISFDLNKTIFLDEQQVIQKLKGGADNG